MVAQALAMTVMIMTGRATEEGVARHLGRRRSGRVVAMVMRPAIPRIRGTEAGSGLGPDILGCRALDFVGTVTCPVQRAGPAWFVGRRAGSGLAMQDGQGGQAMARHNRSQHSSKRQCQANGNRWRS